MFIRLFSLPQSLKPPKVSNLLTYKRKGFLLLTVISDTSNSGFLIIPVLMSVWNLLESIGFPFSISWKIKSMLPLLIPNGLRLFKVTKMIPRTPNGLAIFFALVLFPVALYLVKIYAFFVNTLATVSN